MTDSLAVRRAQRSLLISLLAGLTLFVLLVLFATRPLAAAPAAAECYATGNGGGLVHHSTDDAEALRAAIGDALVGGEVWVAGTCQGAIEAGGTTQVARIAKDLTIAGYVYDLGAPVAERWTYDETVYATIDALGGGRVFFVENGTNLTLQNLEIANGRTSAFAGGGAMISYDSLTISNTKFISNTTSGLYGGAVAVYGSGNDILWTVNVTFTKNACTNVGACYGGAIAVGNNEVTIVDSSFVDNHTAGSGPDSGGGAIYSSLGPLTVDGSYFGENSSGALGGALYVRAPLAITASEFMGNDAVLDGGAIWTSGTAEITVSHLEGNGASGGAARGGAIFNNGALTISASNVYSNSAYHGGGVFNTTNSALTIGNSSEVSWNAANTGFGSGGGVRNEGTLAIADSNFDGNRGYSGGAISTNNGLQLQQTLLENNVAGSGGAIAHSGGTSTIENATFTGNHSTGTPNEFSEPGGGAISTGQGHMMVRTSTLTDNQATNRGGAIYLSTSFSANLLVTESEISRNAADYGGGFYVRDSTTITASRIFDNQAIDGGALVATGPADVVLTNNFVAGNEASGSGDTIYFDNAGEQAGTLDATHNTFVGTGDGTALETNGELSGYAVTLINSIFSGYETAILTAGSGDVVTVDGVLWHDVTAQTSGTGITVVAAYEYVGDPAFLNPATNDYHLLPASAAIDRGVTTGVVTDIDGEPRPAGSAPDLGADEVQLLMPDLVIGKTVEPANPAPGTQVTYHITFRNAGVGTVEDVVVSDLLPATLEVLSVTSDDFELPPGTGTTWQIGELADGAGGTITVVAQVLPGVSVGTDIVNEATISGSTEEFTLINNATSVTITVGDHMLYLPLIMK